ncbi:MAG TPA: hypothetical protein VNQ79_01325 [Blastocatellia bacterium]|nr:hypothetical protein [Blastocatellia bacterium]
MKLHEFCAWKSNPVFRLRGGVIEKLTVRAGATQSYALFLPSSYSSERREGNQSRTLRQQDRRQELRAREFFTLCDSLRRSESPTQSSSQIRRLSADLEKKAEDQHPTSERTVSHRLRTQFFIAASEAGSERSRKIRARNAQARS